MTPEQTRQYIVGWMLKKLAREYPALPPAQVRKLAANLARKTHKSLHGGRLYLQLEPATRWDGLKEKAQRFLPARLRRFFPVNYREIG